MQLSRKLTLTFSLLFILFAFCQNIFACSCLEYFTPTCAKVGRTDAVFLGKIDKLYKYEYTPNGWVLTEADSVEHKNSHGTKVKIRFLVETVYKGNLEEVLEVETDIGSSCTSDFSNLYKGDKWLVFADRNEKNTNWFMSVGMCSYSRRFDKKEIEEINFLVGFAQGKRKTSIDGMVISSNDGFVKNAVVKASAKGFSSSVISDKNGRFSLQVPKPGKYKINVTVPFSATPDYQYDINGELNSFRRKNRTIVEYVANVAENQCDYKFIFLQVELRRLSKVLLPKK